ncbi:hypothetical protein ACTWP4_00190 [Gracilibacillus sp. D59]|uniref:hypothetical protein n=1 Tax=Gracilibacillus sp. D59 TaxID=3457434 RepID=UPI003FCC2D27
MESTQDRYELKTSVDVNDHSILIKVYDRRLKNNFFCFEEDVEYLQDDALRTYILENMYDIKAGKYHVEQFEESAQKDFPNIFRR